MAAPKNGATATLVLRPGRVKVGPGQYEDFERTVTGEVRKFEVRQNVYATNDDGTRGAVVDVVVSEHWEIATGDPAYPAIGFDPETAEFK